MELKERDAGRQHYLDGLRGVAATIVLFAHLTIALLPAVVTFNPSEGHIYRFERELGLSPLGWIWNGEFAVCIFFVLSGYVLSDFCIRTKISFPAQVVRRYFRLALPMLITSFFAYLLLKIGAYKNYDAAVEVTHSGWLSMWYHGFDANFSKMAYEAVYGAFEKGSAVYNSNLWTMRIELFGSVAIFLIHVLCRNVKIRAVVLLIYVAVNRDNFYSLFAVGAFFYDIEAVAKLYVAKMIPDAVLRERISIFGCLFGLFCGSYPHVQPGMKAHWHFFLPYNGVYTIGWHMIGASILVFSLLSAERAQRLLSGALARYLGRVSFVLYLIHLPIICCVGAWSAYLLRGLPYIINLAVTAPLTIAVAFFMSTLIYRFVDLRTTAFSRDSGKFVDRLFPPLPNSRLSMGHAPAESPAAE
jgi:peptidoglycan/LPS O-acetylase OafA/YrhL